MTIKKMEVDGCLYELCTAFIRGVEDRKTRVNYSDNPYNCETEEEKYAQWNYGHEIESEYPGRTQEAIEYLKDV